MLIYTKHMWKIIAPKQDTLYINTEIHLSCNTLQVVLQENLYPSVYVYLALLLECTPEKLHPNHVCYITLGMCALCLKR